MKHCRKNMSPGIGLMKRRLEKEKDAIALAISGIAISKFIRTSFGVYLKH